MHSLNLSWKLMLFVGVVAMVIGLPLYVFDFLAVSSIDPGGAQYIGGQPGAVGADPRIVRWMVHENKEALFSLFVIGFAASAISVTAFRRAERWSWFTLAVLTVGYLLSYIAIHAPIGYLSYFPIVVPLLLVSMVGLALPFRRFFSQGAA